MPRVTFVSPNGTRRDIEAPAGKTVLEIAWDNDIGIEGACEASLACSTCHVIVDTAHFAVLAEPSEEEEDMLDLAYGLQPTSRLGCQLVITDAFDGIELTLPLEVNNQMDD